MKKNWWKYLCVVLLLYNVIGGMLLPVPAKAILNETIRNLYFHVPMWFTMIIILTVSMIYSIKYLSKPNFQNDIIAAESAKTGIFFGILGLVTGMIWAKYTWGEWWSNDPKQNASAVALLIYLAYLVLRNSIPDTDKKAKVAAVYNIFAYAALIPLIFILPRLTDSLHPGSGGNPGFNAYDLEGSMRIVFYPSVIGWILFGVWLVSIRSRIMKIKMENDKM